MTTTVALIGVGAMGAGVGRCLLARGFAVRACDVRAEPVAALAREGATACGSPAEAGTGADAALLLVLNADQVEEVVFGPDGLVGRLPRGAVVVCASTMSASRARLLADRAAGAGLQWLDAPVSGGTQRAAEGTLTSMVGGAPDAIERSQPLLQAYSRDVFHLGPVGAGSTAKLVNQVLVYCNLAATVEAVTLCQKLGVDVQSVYDVICTAMGASAVFESRVPRLIDGTLQSGGSLRIALKDLGIVEETARELGIPMPMSAQATQLFRATAASGSINQDDLALARLMQHLAGLGGD
jgi:3-hydroxyisobutyrate dehydrogenase